MKIFKVLKSGRGFTLVELGIVIGMLATLIGFATISLLNVQQKASINTTVQVIIADLKAQQAKAMIGDTEGRPTPSPYGVHLDNDQYVLFYGSTYSSTETTNFVVKLSENLEFTTPSTDIIFSQTTGEISSPVSITIRNTSSEEKTIQLNKYGVVTGVN
ncbi:MAG: type II secretion system protein [Candidatus Levybacteria bacterium]|nr:type II secretion system protein [Candidatus Levybacteria bacterium]